MAVIPIAQLNPYGSSAVQAPTSVRLSDAQTGNGASTNAVDRGDDRGPGAVQINSTVGASATVTVAIEGSLDGSTWFAVPYTTPAVPGTLAVATFAITTATVVRQYLAANFAWRYLRLNYTANTNVTLTADYFA